MAVIDTRATRTITVAVPGIEITTPAVPAYLTGTVGQVTTPSPGALPTQWCWVYSAVTPTMTGNPAFAMQWQSPYSWQFGRRYEATVQEARDAREVIVGSFDVLIARGGHRTNQIMKVLTLTSVILLPGALLAGIMGMNFKVGIFDHAALFWVVLALIVGVAPLAIGIAKRRAWI